MSTIFKSLPMEVKANENKNLVFKISTNIPDRDDDILEPAGARMENYRANPCVLWSHSYDSLPVGKSLRETVYPDYIESEVEFAPTPFAQDVKKLCEEGFLNAASVGFIGHKFEPIEGSRFGKRYTEWELLEWSVVPVPSNFGSLLQNAKAKGINLDALEKELMQMEPEVKEFELDTKNNQLKINQDGEVKSITFEFLKSLDEDAIKDYEAWKSGATVSAKNRKLLEAIHGGFDGNTKQLKEFLDAVMPMDPDDIPENMPMTIPIMNPDDMISAMRTMVASEVKGALESFETQVLSLLPKDASKDEIDLDAIKFPVTAKNPADIELNIEPEELKNMIANSVREAIIGGMKQ